MSIENQFPSSSKSRCRAPYTHIHTHTHVCTHTHTQLHWRDVSWATKFRFFNFWQVLLLAASSLSLYEAAHALLGYRVGGWVEKKEPWEYAHTQTYTYTHQCCSAPAFVCDRSCRSPREDACRCADWTHTLTHPLIHSLTQHTHTSTYSGPTHGLGRPCCAKGPGVGHALDLHLPLPAPLGPAGACVFCLTRIYQHTCTAASCLLAWMWGCGVLPFPPKRRVCGWLLCVCACPTC